MSNHDTIVAIATASGRSGIGVVRVSGRYLGEFTKTVCARELQPRVAALCKFCDKQGDLIDRGIALYFQGPQSYTGEDVLEIQAHGGPVVLQSLLKRCLELGARVAEPGEFTKRAYLNGKIDLAQAEGVADLIDAATDQAARCANRSIQGEFSTEINALGQRLLALRALTEATLDFPEEEIEAETRDDQMRSLTSIQEQLTKLLEASDQGSLLRDGAQVVLLGLPNAGKSSLFNRLAGEELAIVTEIPGTTRDALRQNINLLGMPVLVIDTAGLRESSDPLEHIGMARTWSSVEKADLAILVVDGTKGESADDLKILSRLPKNLPYLRAESKADLSGKLVGRTLAGENAGVTLSAKTGEGVGDLRLAIADALGWRGNAEGIFMARARHLEALRQSRSALLRARTEIKRQELFAEELRDAHDALMSITGEFTSDDLLGEIFSRFCIGK